MIQLTRGQQIAGLILHFVLGIAVTVLGAVAIMVGLLSDGIPVIIGGVLTMGGTSFLLWEHWS